MSRLPFVIGGLALLLGCAEEVVPPTPPDLRALVQQYEAPSGRVTAESARELVEQTATEFGLVENFDVLIGLVDTVFADLGRSGTQEAQEGLAVQHHALTVGETAVAADGWIVYHRICPGANGVGVRGRLRMTMLGNLNGIKPTVWGAAQDCRIDGSSVDGDIAIHLEQGVDEITGGIVQIDGRLKLGETVFDGIFSASWSDAAVLTYTELPSLGGFLVGVDSATSQIVIEGVNGRFRCDASACEGPDERFEW